MTGQIALDKTRKLLEQALESFIETPHHVSIANINALFELQRNLEEHNGRQVHTQDKPDVGSTTTGKKGGSKKKAATKRSYSRRSKVSNDNPSQ